MDPLYLTAVEKKQFDALTEKLRDGWEVKEEKLTYEDTPEKRDMRLHLLRLHDPKLTALRDKATQAKSADALVTLILENDLSGVRDADIAELFFALGPVPLTFLCAHFLKGVKTDDDLENIAMFTGIRHALLSSHAPIPA